MISVLNKKKNLVLVWNIDNINKIRKLGLKTSGRAILYSQLTKLEKKGKEKKLKGNLKFVMSHLGWAPHGNGSDEIQSGGTWENKAD